MIRIENITKRYASGAQALKGVSFTIEKGETLCLLGVNGSGKTTLSSILATLHPPTSGDILYNDKSIFGSEINNFRRILGLCPQKPNLHPLLNVEENLYYDGRYYGFSHEQTKKKLDELVECFGLEKYRKYKATELSGGYQQRVIICRALMHNPEFIILDEPTVGLDPATRKHLWKIIGDLKKTVLLTTHYLEEADALADRICILDKGRVILLDSTQNVRSMHNNSSLEDIFIKLTEEEAK